MTLVFIVFLPPGSNSGLVASPQVVIVPLSRGYPGANIFSSEEGQGSSLTCKLLLATAHIVRRIPILHNSNRPCSNREFILIDKINRHTWPIFEQAGEARYRAKNQKAT